MSTLLCRTFDKNMFLICQGKWLKIRIFFLSKVFRFIKNGYVCGTFDKKDKKIDNMAQQSHKVFIINGQGLLIKGEIWGVRIRKIFIYIYIYMAQQSHILATLIKSHFLLSFIKSHTPILITTCLRTLYA